MVEMSVHTGHVVGVLELMFQGVNGYFVYISEAPVNFPREKSDRNSTCIGHGGSIDGIAVSVAVALRQAGSR